MISRRMFGPWILGSIAAATLVGGTVSAEIGVAIQDPGSPTAPRPYIVGIIVDDPNPYGNIWTRVGPVSNNRFALNPEGSTSGDGRPSIALHPATHVPLVVWSRRVQGGYEVVLSRFEDGVWTVPQVLAGGTVPAHDPAIAIDPSDGSVHVVYWEEGPERRVLHRSAGANLTAWGPASVVSQPGESAARPALVFHDGALRVAYEVHTFGFGATPRNVVISRLEGASFVPEVLAVTHFEGDVRPEVDSHAGRLWVSWVDSNGELGWARRVGAGGWEPLRYEPYSDVRDREWDARARVRSQAIR